jgi:cobalamin biosynthesis protein CobD/CbiB
MAGALGVRLGGDNMYAGEIVSSHQLGREFPQPSLKQTKGAIQLVSIVALFGLASCILISVLSGHRSSRTVS